MKEECRVNCDKILVLIMVSRVIYNIDLLDFILNYYVLERKKIYGLLMN